MSDKDWGSDQTPEDYPVVAGSIEYSAKTIHEGDKYDRRQCISLVKAMRGRKEIIGKSIDQYGKRGKFYVGLDRGNHGGAKANLL